MLAVNWCVLAAVLAQQADSVIPDVTAESIIVRVHIWPVTVFMHSYAKDD